MVTHFDCNWEQKDFGEWRGKRQLKEEIQEIGYSGLLVIQTLSPDTSKSYTRNNPALFSLHKYIPEENTMFNSDTLSGLI